MNIFLFKEYSWAKHICVFSSLVWKRFTFLVVSLSIKFSIKDIKKSELDFYPRLRLGELQASGKATRQMISLRCIGTCMYRRLAYIYHKQFPSLGIYRIRYCSHGSNQTSACKRTSFALLRLVVAKWLKRHGTKQGNSRSWGIWFRPVEGTEYSKWKSLRIKKFEGKFWDHVSTYAENFCQNYTMYLWNCHNLFVCYCFTIMRKIYDWLITFRC